ncbi:MAG: hypothetical protein AAFX41_03280, partial [Bacteroidota bacterium]
MESTHIGDDAALARHLLHGTHWSTTPIRPLDHHYHLYGYGPGSSSWYWGLRKVPAAADQSYLLHRDVTPEETEIIRLRWNALADALNRGGTYGDYLLKLDRLTKHRERFADELQGANYALQAAYRVLDLVGVLRQHFGADHQADQLPNMAPVFLYPSPLGDRVEQELCAPEGSVCGRSSQLASNYGPFMFMMNANEFGLVFYPHSEEALALVSASRAESELALHSRRQGDLGELEEEAATHCELGAADCTRLARVLTAADFQRSVLENVLVAYEVFNHAPKWEELSTDQMEGLTKHKELTHSQKRWLQAAMNISEHEPPPTFDYPE